MRKEKCILAILLFMGIGFAGKVNAEESNLMTGPEVRAQATALDSAIIQGKFADAQKIVGDVIKESKLQGGGFYPFDGFIHLAVDEEDDALRAGLDKWVEQDKNSAYAYLLHAYFYYYRGWLVRGTKVIKDVSPEHRWNFDEYVYQAADDLNKSITFDAKNPYTYLLFLRVARVKSSNATKEAIFNESVARFPEYSSLYEERLAQLALKWGGSLEGMYFFVYKNTAHLPPASPLKMLQLQMFISIGDTMDSVCKNPQDSCRKKFADLLNSPEMKSKLEDSFTAYWGADPVHFAITIYNKFNDYISNDNRKKLLDMASAKLGPDNFILNYEYADLYQNKLGSAASAAPYAKKALEEIKAFPFPEEYQRKFFASRVNELLAKEYNSNGNTQLALTYVNAAIAEDAYNAEPYVDRCELQFRAMQNQEAVNDCTKAINMHWRNYYPSFLRGQAYYNLRQLPQAKSDLNAVLAAPEDKVLADWKVVASDLLKVIDRLSSHGSGPGGHI